MSFFLWSRRVSRNRHPYTVLSLCWALLLTVAGCGEGTVTTPGSELPGDSERETLGSTIISEVEDPLDINSDSDLIGVAEVTAPACEFTVHFEGAAEPADEFDGPPPLRVTSTFVSIADDLPADAVLTWTVDGVSESGKMAAFRERTNVFTKAGIHTIMLSLAVAGATVDCTTTQTGDLEQQVTVWPRITGKVTDADGNGIADVTVAASAGGTTDVTDSDGSFEVYVTFGWDGMISVQHIDHEFSPSEKRFSDVRTNRTESFTAIDEEISIAESGACETDEDCDDGLHCTGVALCIDGNCVTSMSPCDDGIDCTVDSCDEENNTCEHVPDHSVCDNGLFCDGVEVCDPELGCQPGSNPCPGQVCSEDSGTCTAVVPIGCTGSAECDDGLWCNGAERCIGGDCVAGTAPDCDDGVACTVDSCNEATDSCDSVAVDSNCDDGLYCNGVETCDATLDCQPGTPVDCDDGIACTADSCNETTDECDNIPNDSLCDNGLFCDGAEVCSLSLGCQPGSDPCPAEDCDENNDTCVPVDCTGPEDCDDGLWCNGAETCSGGVCIAGTAPDCDDGVACTDDSCNETTESCDNIANNANCDNGLYCDGAEICHTILGCRSTLPVDCDDGVGCTDDSCNEATDSCDNIANNANCDNGLYCDGVETCDATLDCQSGTPVNCDDGVGCTDDSCNEATDSCDNVANDANCPDDGLYCNGTESCDAVNNCVSSGDPCQVDETCDEDADTCEPAGPVEDEWIAVGDTWRYFKGTTAPPANWADADFSDGAWLSGPTGIGYSSDISYATELDDMSDNYVSVFMRRAFTVADPSEHAALTLGAVYDDGFIAYINGQEVARSDNMVDPVDYDTLTTAGHDEEDPEEEFTITVTPGLLETGTNILAIELHNVDAGSSDAGILPRLESAGGEEPECTGAADCDDGDACTVDACVDTVCENTPVDCPTGQACNPANGECEATGEPSVTISGVITDDLGTVISSVQVVADNGGGSASTDGDGEYALSVSSGWSGTVTPTHAMFTFAPASVDYTDVTSAQTDQDFVGTATGAFVSGTITLVDTVGARPPIGQHGLIFTGTGSSAGEDYLALTDVDGTYVRGVPEGWTGTIEAEDPSRVFLTPETLSVSSVPGSGLSNQDFTAWTAPIGIPGPEFGIKEVAPPYNAANPLHYYVDNSHPSATDSGNPNGSPDTPRASLPSTTGLQAGTLIYIHGGTYGNGGYRSFNGNGTASNPIFITGNPLDPPRFGWKFSVSNNATYMVFENLDVDGTVNDYAGFEIIAPCEHIALRNSDLHHRMGSCVMIGSFGADLAAHIVIFNCTVHDNGDMASPNDDDHNAVGVAKGASNVSILDSELYNNSGDGVIVNAGNIGSMPTTHHIYAGRNHVYSCRQGGIYSKQAVDVIFSQNDVHDIVKTSWNPSIGLGFQYQPERVWFLHNTVYNCEYGIYAGSNSSGGFGQDAYIVGNVIHSIHHIGSYTPSTAWSQAGIMLAGGVNRYIVNNTIYDVDAGLNGPGGGQYSMANNLIANLTEPEGNHVFIEDPAGTTTWSLDNSLLYQGGDYASVRWRNNVYSLPQLQAIDRAAGCVDADPRFLDAQGLDFHLQSNSPAIDIGMAEYVYTEFLTRYGISIAVDNDGAPRTTGMATDAGAYE